VKGIPGLPQFRVLEPPHGKNPDLTDNEVPDFPHRMIPDLPNKEVFGLAHK
jgi:hypothetical protein